MLVLVHPSGPTAIFGWCELLPKTFDLNGFLLFSAGGSIEQRQHPIPGLYYHPLLYEPYSQDFCRLQQDILDMTDL